MCNCKTNNSMLSLPNHRRPPREQHHHLQRRLQQQITIERRPCPITMVWSKPVPWPRPKWWPTTDGPNANPPLRNETIFFAPNNDRLAIPVCHEEPITTTIPAAPPCRPFGRNRPWPTPFVLPHPFTTRAAATTMTTTCLPMP